MLTRVDPKLTSISFINSRCNESFKEFLAVVNRSQFLEIEESKQNDGMTAFF